MMTIPTVLRAPRTVPTTQIKTTAITKRMTPPKISPMQPLFSESSMALEVVLKVEDGVLVVP